MLTDIRTYGRTHGRTDRPSYRDARTHLKNKQNKIAPNCHLTTNMGSVNLKEIFSNIYVSTFASMHFLRYLASSPPTGNTSGGNAKNKWRSQSAKTTIKDFFVGGNNPKFLKVNTSTTTTVTTTIPNSSR